MFRLSIDFSSGPVLCTEFEWTSFPLNNMQTSKRVRYSQGSQHGFKSHLRIFDGLLGFVDGHGLPSNAFECQHDLSTVKHRGEEIINSLFIPVGT